MTLGGSGSPLSTFSVTWWTGNQADKSDEEHRFDGHYPYTRPLRLGWTRTREGEWVSSSEDPKQWEVFCQQCDAREGPAEVQPEAARRLVGPYPSKHKAEHVAKKHFDETNPG